MMFKHSGNRKSQSHNVEIKNPYIYKSMMDALNHASDEKYNHITIETFKFLARRVSNLTARFGLKDWDRVKDIMLLSELINELKEHINVMPENSQNLANSIFSEILQIKQYEDRENKNEYTLKLIMSEVDWVMKKLNEMKS